MSYIRSGSNPEGLYIWQDVEGYIAVTGKNVKGLVRVSVKDWKRLLRGYSTGKYYNGGRVGSLQLREVTIRTGPPVTIPTTGKWLRVGNNYVRDSSGYRIAQKPIKFTPSKTQMELEIRRPGKRSIKVVMWRVTWEYICRRGS